MSAYLKALQSEPQAFMDAYYAAHQRAAENAVKEYKAAVVIQKRFAVKQRIKRNHLLAREIQRFYRGWLGRKRYRRQLEIVWDRMQKDYYDHNASLIQATWKGYYTRKHIHNFYARKAYLKSLEQKNDVVREGLRQYEADLHARLAELRLKEAKAREEESLRKTHHLLSTQVLDGVHCSKTGVEEKMRTLRRQELKTLPKPLGATARTEPTRDHDHDHDHDHDREHTHIHRHSCFLAGIVCTCSRRLPQPLPRVQGPFRAPQAVQTLRNRPLRPTLRVATQFDSERAAKIILGLSASHGIRVLERQDESCRRIADTGFMPFAHTQKDVYTASIRRTAEYVGRGPGDKRLPYGTMTFRDELPTLAASKAFKTVVAPVVLFDEI